MVEYQWLGTETQSYLNKEALISRQHPQPPYPHDFLSPCRPLMYSHAVACSQVSVQKALRAQVLHPCCDVNHEAQETLEGHKLGEKGDIGIFCDLIGKNLIYGMHSCVFLCGVRVCIVQCCTAHINPLTPNSPSFQKHGEKGDSEIKMPH